MKNLFFDAFLLIFLTIASFWIVLSIKPVQVKIMFQLAGDFNDSIDSPLLKEITKHFTINSGDEATFPADEPNERIDFVATFNNCPTETLESIVIEEKEASDHRPLLVKIQLPSRTK